MYFFEFFYPLFSRNRLQFLADSFLRSRFERIQFGQHAQVGYGLRADGREDGGPQQLGHAMGSIGGIGVQ
jgi:hypothetical protein